MASRPWRACGPSITLRPHADRRATEDRDDVKARVSERDIRFIRFWFTDILGQLKSFSINAQELDDAFEAGMGFDGSSITGFNAIEESDMIAMPDPPPSRSCLGAPKSRAWGGCSAT